MEARKREKKGSMGKLILISISLLLLASFVILTSALSDDEQTSLQSELDNLTSRLSSQGYSWLVDYSGDDLYSRVEVYRENAEYKNVDIFEEKIERREKWIKD